MQRPDSNFEYTANNNAGDSGDRQVFNIQTGELQSFTNFALVTIGPEPNSLFVQNHGRLDEFQIWDMGGRKAELQRLQYNLPWTSFDYSPDGQQLVAVNGLLSATPLSTTAIYDAQTLEEILRFDTDINLPFDINWSPDGRYIATTTREEGIIIWNPITGTEVRRITDIEQDHITSVQFTSDSRYVLSGHGSIHSNLFSNDTPTLFMWDIETGEVIQRIEFPDNSSESNWGIINLAVHPNRNLAHVTVNEFWDGTVQSAILRSYLVNLDTGLIIPTLPDIDIFSSDFTPDGQFVVVTEFGGNNIWVLDAETGVVVRSWTALESDLFGIAISPDGRYLATGSGLLAFETAVSLWDFETGKLIRRYFGHGQQSWVVDIGFSPDGTQLISAAFDNTIRTWDMDTQSTLDWVRENRVVRDFTCAEREQYRIEPLCNE